MARNLTLNVVNSIIREVTMVVVPPTSSYHSGPPDPLPVGIDLQTAPCAQPAGEPLHGERWFMSAAAGIKRHGGPAVATNPHANCPPVRAQYNRAAASQ